MTASTELDAAYLVGWGARVELTTLFAVIIDVRNQTREINSVNWRQ